VVLDRAPFELNFDPADTCKFLFSEFLMALSLSLCLSVFKIKSVFVVAKSAIIAAIFTVARVTESVTNHFGDLLPF